MAPQRVCVLSAGAWGVVLASHLARKGHDVIAFDLPQTVTALQKTQSHPKLPGFRLPESLRLTSDLKDALIAHDPQCIVVTTPSHVMRQVTSQCRALEEEAGYTGTPPWVVCSKAIEESSLMTMTDVIESVRGAAWRNRLAVLSGPSFAAEVALEKPTSVIAAAGNEVVSAYVQALFMTERFRVYSHDDMLGAELGGRSRT
jgi:glycerol-3-phosphate dehydrogenase (NAD(P)+)